MIKLSVQDMSCGGCVKSIRQALETIDPLVDVEADLATGIVAVESTADAEEIKAAIIEAGFPAQLT